ncbi:MAG: response regulator, partial [Bdellovibrionota bacterium]
MFDKSTRVLIVDDMLTMRKLVGKICKDLGFTDLVEAADGNLAWSLLESSKPGIGLVISDWNMPNCSGLEFLR